tara:strand:+ start:258 stop:536 length:279 start_codon:yes stop_codon:yes gene_type:complete
MINEIKSIIQSELPDAKAVVYSPRQDDHHFEAIVISAEFETLSLVKQHQRVMNALKTRFETDLHALALKTFTPQQWDQNKDQFPADLITLLS